MLFNLVLTPIQFLSANVVAEYLHNEKTPTTPPLLLPDCNT